MKEKNYSYFTDIWKSSNEKNQKKHTMALSDARVRA